MAQLTTWRKEITNALITHGETFRQIESCTLTEPELDLPFDNGYGRTNGIPFTVWTVNNVYFPVCYDGAEWCACVPRHPNGEATYHIGG